MLIPDKQILSHLNGIDFNLPVEIIEIQGGTQLMQYTKINTLGEPIPDKYYTNNPYNTPSELGISE